MKTVAKDINFTVRFDQAAGKVRHVLQRAHLSCIEPYSEQITTLPSIISNLQQKKCTPQNASLNYCVLFLFDAIM
jgi:hypothetical protein